MKLKEVQKEAVENLAPGKVLWGNVGSGKTITSLAYFFTKICNGEILDAGGIKKAVSPVRLYIITTAKKRDSLDWEKEAAQFGISDTEPYFMTVDSWNNIFKYVGISNAFFIFDEQRAVGRGKWAKSFIKIAKKNKWILLSATPGDTWMDYVPLFIANGFYRTFGEFNEKHVIYNRFSKYPKIDEFRGTATLEHLKQKILVPMRISREEVQINKIHYETSYNKSLYSFIKENRGYYKGDEYYPIKSLPELAHILRKVANSDDDKLTKLRGIFLMHHRLIVFYKFDYELEKLLEFAKGMQIPVAQLNGHKHEDIPNTIEWLYLVQYTSGAEAWNCIKTDCTVFYCLDYSYKIMEQAAGRINRMNSPYTSLYYYYLFSSSPFDKAIWRSIQSKKIFNEQKFIEKSTKKTITVMEEKNT